MVYGNAIPKCLKETTESLAWFTVDDNIFILFFGA